MDAHRPSRRAPPDLDAVRAALEAESRSDLPRPRLILFALGLAAALGAGLLGARSLLRPAGERRVTMEEAAEAQREVAESWGRSETMAPRVARIEEGSGERVSPFAGGFAVSVDSRPPGGRVRVNGREVGEAPVLAGVDCRPGEPVAIRVEKAGLRAATRTTRCRADAVVHLELALTR
jgi:hypothetical protein